MPKGTPGLSEAERSKEQNNTEKWGRDEPLGAGE